MEYCRCCVKDVSDQAEKKQRRLLSRATMQTTLQTLKDFVSKLQADEKLDDIEEGFICRSDQRQEPHPLNIVTTPPHNVFTTPTVICIVKETTICKCFRKAGILLHFEFVSCYLDDEDPFLAADESMALQ